MSGNTFGTFFRLTTFGESHGVALGGVIDGCPAGLPVDMRFINREMQRRKPGSSKISSSRNENDNVKFLSGILDGVTTGAPLAFLIPNNDARGSDYDELKNIFRPSHADYTYFMKYGIKDYQGGGRASARETAVRVAAGAIAKIVLNEKKISVHACTTQIGSIPVNKELKHADFIKAGKNVLFCPDKDVSDKMISCLENLKKDGDTTGGIVSCLIGGCPAGLGEPVFDKLQSDLAKAMMSIPAAKGFEYGEGFGSAAMKGSQHNDTFAATNKKITLQSNHAGGMLGGISSGAEIRFRVAFKPISSISAKQSTVDINGNSKVIKIKGRHDVCALPRAVPVVEAMAALTIADHYLRYKSYK